MDLVDYSEEVFENIRREFGEFATKLNVPDLTFIPVSALKGDNVVTRSENMPWYEGSSLLHHLETVHVASDRNLVDARFPVQYVIRPQSNSTHDYRGYAGTVAGGVFKPGDEVIVLPSGFTTTIEGIDTADGPVDEAFPPMSVTIRLADEIDISRGDMICRPHNQPDSTQDLDAMVCWMDERVELRPGAKFAVKHTTAVGARPGQGRQLPPRHQHPAPRRDRLRAGAQRDRPDPAAHDPADLRRRLRAQPHHRRLRARSTRRPTAPSPQG